MGKRISEEIAAVWIFVRRKIKNPAAFRQRDRGKAGYQENILKELSEKLVGCDQNQNL